MSYNTKSPYKQAYYISKQLDKYEIRTDNNIESLSIK